MVEVPLAARQVCAEQCLNCAHSLNVADAHSLVVFLRQRLICSRGPTKAAESYYLQQLEHLNTAQLCAERGINYMPLVFTTQGGAERHAEAVFTQLSC